MQHPVRKHRGRRAVRRQSQCPVDGAFLPSPLRLIRSSGSAGAASPHLTVSCVTAVNVSRVGANSTNALLGTTTCRTLLSEAIINILLSSLLFFNVKLVCDLLSFAFWCVITRILQLVIVVILSSGSRTSVQNPDQRTRTLWLPSVINCFIRCYCSPEFNSPGKPYLSACTSVFLSQPVK